MTKKLPRIRKVFGPLKTKIKGHGIAWSFTGIREDGEFCRWILWFGFESRRFSTRRRESEPGDEKLMTPGLFPSYEGAEVQESRITPLLRAQLTDHHLAEATERAINYRRRA